MCIAGFAKLYLDERYHDHMFGGTYQLYYLMHYNLDKIPALCDLSHLLKLIHIVMPRHKQACRSRTVLRKGGCESGAAIMITIMIMTTTIIDYCLKSAARPTRCRRRRWGRNIADVYVYTYIYIYIYVYTCVYIYI